MKKFALSLMTFFILASVACGAARQASNPPPPTNEPPTTASASETKTFTGEIMDSPCAKNGSHDEMMKMMKSMGNDGKTCTLKCVEMGGKFVLYDAANKVTYKLDDQDKAKEFAGQKVKVSGSYDGKTIHVEKIEATSGP